MPFKITSAVWTPVSSSLFIKTFIGIPFYYMLQAVAVFGVFLSYFLNTINLVLDCLSYQETTTRVQETNTRTSETHSLVSEITSVDDEMAFQPDEMAFHRCEMNLGVQEMEPRVSETVSPVCEMTSRVSEMTIPDYLLA